MDKKKKRGREILRWMWVDLKIWLDRLDIFFGRFCESPTDVDGFRKNQITIDNLR